MRPAASHHTKDAAEAIRCARPATAAQTRSRADNGRRVFAARNRNQWGGGTLVMRSVFKPPSPNRPAVRALIRSGTAGSGPIRAPGGGPGWPQRPTTRARGPALLFSYGSGATPRCKRHACHPRFGPWATIAPKHAAATQRPHEKWANTIPRSHFRHAIIHKCECEEHATSRF